MKIALGMIVKNERETLEKTLNYKALDFDIRVAVDYMSDDNTVELLGSYGFQLIRQEWGNNYANARNTLTQFAEEQGADYLFMLDADEALYRADLDHLKRLAETVDAIAVPRFEFVQDYDHYDPTPYPDYQCRFFRLNKGMFFTNRLHEMLATKHGDVCLERPYLHTKSLTTPIYHYSRIGDHKRLALKFINYDRITAGLAPLTAVPDNYDPNAKYWDKAELFTKDHPLKKYGTE